MHAQQAFVQGNYCKDIHTCVCTFVHTCRSCISFFESFPSLCCMWIFVIANIIIHKHARQAFVQGNYCKDAFIQIKELDQEEAHQHLHKPTTRIKGLTGYHIPYLWDVTHSYKRHDWSIWHTSASITPHHVLRVSRATKSCIFETRLTRIRDRTDLDGTPTPSYNRTTY